MSFETLGLISAVALPLFNIPLVIKIQARKSSKDISMTWAWGVYVCLWGMLPAGLMSEDFVFRAFAIVNIVFFTGVMVQVMRFRNGSV
ncbi:MAG: hypothetical protein JW937_08990 [Candidatus Omnitrophica bacterium]|nr:hypothetical protein [Candidatus Omnitrophota bacterium]